MRIFTRKNKIAFLLGLILLVVTFFYTWSKYHVTYPPDISSKLSLHLVVDKSQYLKAEPVRLTALIYNKTSKRIVVKYPIERRPFMVRLTKLTKGQTKQVISDIPVPRSLILCGTCLRQLHGRHSLFIEPNCPLVVQEWLIDTQSLGLMTFSSELYTKNFLRGESANLLSNEVTIDYVQPQGKDAEAYNIVANDNLIGYIGSGEGKVIWDLLSPALVSQEDNHNKHAHEFTLGKFDGTYYEPYIWYSTAKLHSFHNCKRYGDIMETLVETAPSDFPLLPKTYISLLRYYQSHYNLPKMAALAKSIPIHQLKILDPKIKAELQHLIDEIAWWPPKTPIEQIRADNAFRIREGIRISSNHWLVEVLLKAYGEHYGNELRFGGCQADKTNLYFYDKVQKECVHITYHFDKSSNLKHVSFYGPLPSVAIGPLKQLSGKIKEKLKLDYQELAVMKISALLKGKTVEGTLFKNKKQCPETHVNFSFDDINLPADKQASDLHQR